MISAEKHHLSSLNGILCGSSVVKPSNYEFAMKKMKKDIWFIVGYGKKLILNYKFIF